MLRRGAIAFPVTPQYGTSPRCQHHGPRCQDPLCSRQGRAQAPAWHRAVGHGALEQPVLPCQTGRIKLSPALWVWSRRSPAERGTSLKSMPPGTPAL